MAKDIFALVDCNSFYASCEKVFNPAIAQKPVGILSNNDGIIVALSSELKKLTPSYTTNWNDIPVVKAI